MAEVKITELPQSIVPNDSAVVPCVVQGTTRQIRLDHVKEYMDIPTVYVTLVQASQPLETTPSNGITGEGTIRIKESSPETPGSMSIEHYNKVQNSSYTSIANRLVIRDGQGSFEANNLTLRAPGEGDTASGTITGNLTQRKTNDVGVNAKLGETTRYTAKVTTLDASDDVNFSKQLSVVAGPLTVGGANVNIQASGQASFSNNVTVSGNLLVEGVGKEIRGAVNTSGTAFPGRFTTLSATTSLNVVGSTTLGGTVSVTDNMTFSPGKTLNAPEGTLQGAYVRATDRFIGTIYEAPQGQTAIFNGTFNGGATRLTTGQTIGVAGVLSGSTPIPFTGESPATIVCSFVDGQIRDRHIAADANISDTKLNTISTGGKVSNSATSATSNNVSNTIVSRNANGDFSARVITAETFSGTATYATALTSAASSSGYNWTGQHYFQNATSGGVTTTYPFPLGCRGDTGAAAMSFHIFGNYAINLGLDTDRVFRLGGYSENGNFRWSADTSGNFTARSNVTAYSDERKKKNWETLPEDIVLKLASVKSGTYERTDVDVKQVGVSAQSLSKILPEAVLADTNGELSVAYGNAALAMCVELAKKVVSLSQEISELKERLN